MGILDNYLGDIKRELVRGSSGIEQIKSVSRKVVETIDQAEEKLNNLPTEEDVKKKLDETLKATKKEAASQE